MTTTEKLESMKLEQASLEKDVERMKERQHKQEQVTRHLRSPDQTPLYPSSQI